MSEDLTPGSPAWMRLVTASKIPAILGDSPWDSPYSMWMKMAGKLPPDKEKAPMGRGLLLEPYTLEWWRRKHPEYGQTQEQVQVKKDDWCLVTPDMVASDDVEEVVVEAKSASRLDSWGAPGTDQIPKYYKSQVQAQLHFTGVKQAYVPLAYLRVFDEQAVITALELFDKLGLSWDEKLDAVAPFVGFHEYGPIKADEEYGREIENYCKWFWESLKSDTPPPLDDHPATYDAVRRIHEGIEDGVAVELEQDMAMEYVDALLTYDNAERRMKAAKARVLDTMVKAEFATWNGELIARRKRNRYNIHIEQVCKSMDLFDNATEVAS